MASEVSNASPSPSRRMGSVLRSSHASSHAGAYGAAASTRRAKGEPASTAPLPLSCTVRA